MTFDSIDAGLAFWERTNAPTIALRVTLPPERYEDFRRDARGLMDKMNISRDGRLALSSNYVRVVARKPAI